MFLILKTYVSYKFYTVLNSLWASELKKNLELNKDKPDIVAVDDCCCKNH